MPTLTSEPEALPDVETIGATLARAIAGWIRDAHRGRRRVLSTNQPEHLHELRVALRRLRAALRIGFDALDLDDSIRRALGQTSRALGELRDLDVAIAEIERRPPGGSPVPPPLSTVVSRLRSRRRTVRARVRRALRSGSVRAALTRLRHWARAPQLHPFGYRSLADVRPALLAPVVEAVDATPAWRAARPTADQLHELRRRARAARYALELLGFDRPSDVETLESMAELQDGLGAVRDLDLTRELASDALEQDLARRAPEFARRLSARSRAAMTALNRQFHRPNGHHRSLA